MTIVANSANSGAEAKATETAPVVEAPKAEKKAGEDIAKVEDVELKPIGRGKFGNIYDQFRGKPKEALAFLKENKEGDLIGVFYHDEIGDIDLVWGDEKSGLSHINSKHVGDNRSFATLDIAIEHIEDIIKSGDVTFTNGDKVVIKKNDELVTLRKNIRENGKKIADKNWILTAYNEKAADNTRAISVVNKGHAAPTTAVSESKGSEKVEDNEGKVNKSEVGRYPKELFEGVKDNAMAVRDAKTIFDKYSKVASIEEMIEYRDTLIAWDYLNGSISDAENGLTKITDEEYDSLLEAQRQTDHRLTEIRDDFEKRLEESQKIEAQKAEKKVRKPRAKSRPVDAKKEISRRLEEEWNDAPSDVKSTIESIANTDEVIDVEDVVYATLAELRSPKTRHKLILQGDGVIKGVTEELGLPAKELQKALGVNAFATRANGGISLQKMAENIVADLDRNITGASNIDVADVRDMLIEAIQSAGEPADISYHRARRRIDVAEKVYADWKRNELELEAEYEREADAERAAEEFWLTEQEKAYESMEINYLDNTFADELAERERIINEQNRISNERINERGLGSNRLLRSQQTDTSGRVEEGSERQGIQEEVGDAVSWIQDAETQRGQVGGTTQRKVEAEVAKASKAKTAKKKAGEDIAKVEEAMKAEKAKRELKTKEDIEKRLAEIREEYEADKEGRDIQTQAEAMVELYGGYANAPKDVKAKIDAQVAKLSARRQELAAEERELEKKLATLAKEQTSTTLDTRTEGQKEDGGYSDNSANSGAVEPYIKTDAELTEAEQKGIEYEINRLADGFGLKPSQLRGVEVKHNADNTAIMVATEWSEGASTARVVELIADNGTSQPDRIWQAYVDGKPASKLMVDEDVNAKDMEELFDERGLLREPTIEDFLKRRGIEFSMADRDKAIGEARFRFSESEEEFRATQKEAVEKKGIVMPNLATTEFEIVHIPRHDFTGTGNQAIEKAEKWAKENLDSQYTYRKGTKDEFVYSIDKDSIGKFLSESSTKKSANLGVHLAVLKKLPDVINASIEAEIHADYKKNDNSRLDENGINDEDLLIHRMYGAVEIDGVIYRAKTTIKERLNKSNNVYDYKVTDIDLVISGSASSDALTKPMSVDGAKLLQGVEKSYDKGKYLLDESVKNVKSSEEEDDYSGESGVRFRFIGEEGAKSMDKKEGTTARMDNLAVAKKMLDEYSYKEVKMATGWEKGMDGKWRYETPDFEKFDVNGNLKFEQRHPDYARYRELVKKSKKPIDKYNIKMHRRVQKGSPMLCFRGVGVDSSYSVYSGDDWCSLLTKEQKYKLWELKLRELLLILWVIL